MIKFYNGYEIPKLGLGTFLMNDDNEIKNTIQAALNVGYRHFDTAQMYKNETAIGEALVSSGLSRNEYYITTKLHNHHSKEITRKLILESMDNLKTDYLDLLLIHWPNHDDEINLSTWEVFEELYLEGKLKAIGVSNFTRFQLSHLLNNCKIKPMVNQVEFHPGLSQVQMINYLNKHDIKITSYGPLMRGKLVESPYNEVLTEIANAHNASVAQVVISWGLSKGVMMIPKTVNENRLTENFKSKDLKLTEEEILTIDKLNTGRRFYSDPANNVYGKFIK